MAKRLPFEAASYHLTLPALVVAFIVTTPAPHLLSGVVPVIEAFVTVIVLVSVTVEQPPVAVNVNVITPLSLASAV